LPCDGGGDPENAAADGYAHEHRHGIQKANLARQSLAPAIRRLYGIVSQTGS
jgi:hypothetical protein